MKLSRDNTEARASASVQFWVFSLVTAAFTTIYITQPVLPIIQTEFGVDETRSSLTISAVIFGIALSNLPLGVAADRFAIKPIIFMGGCVITLCGLVCAQTRDMSVLIATRFVQGLFIPCLTTCVAAYIARTLPHESLNVVMGSYVSATVAGGLSGRLLGGFVHPPLHWRYAFVTASVFLSRGNSCSLLLPAIGEKEVQRLKLKHRDSFICSLNLICSASSRSPSALFLFFRPCSTISRSIFRRPPLRFPRRSSP